MHGEEQRNCADRALHERLCHSRSARASMAARFCGNKCTAVFCVSDFCFTLHATYFIKISTGWIFWRMCLKYDLFNGVCRTAFETPAAHGDQLKARIASPRITSDKNMRFSTWMV